MNDRIEEVKASTSSANKRFVHSRLFQSERRDEKDTLPSSWQLPIPDVAFGLLDHTETKTWVFAEWYIPPIGSGRTIIDLWGPPKLTLVRTTTVGGAKALYIAIQTNIRVWNPFVSGHEAILSATVLDVGQNFVFGSFPSGCGVNTWIVRNVNVRDDIFDAANSANLSMSPFSFFYC